MGHDIIRPSTRQMTAIVAGSCAAHIAGVMLLLAHSAPALPSGKHLKMSFRMLDASEYRSHPNRDADSEPVLTCCQHDHVVKRARDKPDHPQDRGHDATRGEASGVSSEADISAANHMMPATPDHGDDATPRTSSTSEKVADLQPRLIEHAQPVYPSMLREQGIEGRVILLLEVDEAGRVKTVSITQSSGYRLFDQAALQAARHWRFQPARRDGLPIQARTTVPVRFELGDPQAG
ncbi:energy transducer TonB [Burkholderiaceae bacterium DAT-1]|nr:energy transducer TonB [Burkholderiaceae bacterium DAT-1]